VVMTVSRGLSRRIEEVGSAAVTRMVDRAVGGRAGRCVQVGPCGVYPLRRVLARELVRAHCTLVGNAAHFLHPVAGQGLNLALRGGLRLLDAIRSSEAPLGALSALNQFATTHRDDVAKTAALGHGFISAFGRTGAGYGALRALGFGALSLTSVRREFITQLSGRDQPKIWV